MGKRVERRIDEQNNKELKKNSKTKTRRILKVLLILVVVLLMLGALIVGYGYISLSKINNNKVPAKKVSSNKPVNILILGVDAGDYTNHTKYNPNRSDTMMLVRYNPITDRAYIMSLPRDTKVTSGGQSEKLNAAHLKGSENTISTIEKLLNIDINYYVEINYQGFRECIDAIGGVAITIPRDMNYDAWKINIHFKKGEVVTMNGTQAEEYVRWRKNNDGSGYPMGDIGRISTQQEFIVQIIKKLKTPMGILRMPILINTITKYIETNMSPDTMLEYAFKAKGIKPEMIQKEILPGEAKYIGAASYYIWNKDLNDKFVENFRGIESVDSTKNVQTPADNTKPIDNNNSTITAKGKNIEVILLNSTGKAGLAALYKTKLERLGYRVTQTANYAYNKLTETLINDYSSHNYGALLESDLKFGEVKIKQKAKPLASLVVILGKDSIK